MHVLGPSASMIIYDPPTFQSWHIIELIVASTISIMDAHNARTYKLLLLIFAGDQKVNLTVIIESYPEFG